jgi:hypothetical protein
MHNSSIHGRAGYIIIIIIIIIIKSTQGRVVAPLRDLVISLDLPVLQLRELINWQVHGRIVALGCMDGQLDS